MVHFKIQTNRLHKIMSDKSKSLTHNLLLCKVVIGLEAGVRVKERWETKYKGVNNDKTN